MATQIRDNSIVRCPLSLYDRGWNAALRRCITILCPQPPVEEERECTIIAKEIRHLQRKGALYKRGGKYV